MEKLVDLICIKDGEGNWIQIKNFTKTKTMMKLESIDVLGKKDVELAKLHPQFQWFFENSKSI